MILWFSSIKNGGDLGIHISQWLHEHILRRYLTFPYFWKLDVADGTLHRFGAIYPYCTLLHMINDIFCLTIFVVKYLPRFPCLLALECCSFLQHIVTYILHLFVTYVRKGLKIRYRIYKLPSYVFLGNCAICDISILFIINNFIWRCY